MELGFDSRKLKKFLVIDNFKKNYFEFFSRQIKIVVVLLSLILFGYCVYIWHENIYAPDWSDARKQEYIKSKEQIASFNRVGFENVVSEFELRESEMQKELRDPVDIFRVIRNLGF